MERWNPWRELRRRTHLRLVWGSRGSAGSIDNHGNLWLDPELDRVERRSVLAHELVHDDRGIFEGAPEIVAREEKRVDEIVACRLVPLLNLAVWLKRREPFGVVEVWEVAEEFDVTEHMARIALASLRHPRSRLIREAARLSSASDRGVGHE